MTTSNRPDPRCGDPRKWWVTALSNDLVRYVNRASTAVFAARLRGPCGERPAIIRLAITVTGDDVGLSIELVGEDDLERILEDAGLEMVEVNGKFLAEELALLLNDNIVGDPLLDR